MVSGVQLNISSLLPHSFAMSSARKCFAMSAAKTPMSRPCSITLSRLLTASAASPFISASAVVNRKDESMPPSTP